MKHTTEDGREFKELADALAHEQKLHNKARKEAALKLIEEAGAMTKKAANALIDQLLGLPVIARRLIDTLHPLPPTPGKPEVKKRPRAKKVKSTEGTSAESEDSKANDNPGSTPAVKRPRGRPSAKKTGTTVPPPTTAPQLVITSPPQE